MHITSFSADVLNLSGKFATHSTFDHAINVQGSTGAFLSLVTQLKPLIPCGIRVPMRDFQALANVTHVYLEGRCLVLGAQRFYLWGPGVDLKLPDVWAAERLPLLESVRSFLKYATRGYGPLLDENSELMRRLCQWGQQGQLQALVHQLVGYGPGLTPSGDDFLVGLLWAWTAFKHPYLPTLQTLIEAHLARTHRISANFLRHAIDGYFVEPLCALARSPEQRLPALVVIAQQGASSGHDMLAGLRFGLSLSVTSIAD